MSTSLTLGTNSAKSRQYKKESKISFSAIAIALGSSILGALGQQTLDKALQAGQLALALPAALHLLAVYPPKTISRRETGLWPVVEALIEQGQTEVRKIGLSAARWLALRPGYSYGLQACEALLEAGEVDRAICLLSQAVVAWLRGEAEVSLQTLRQAQQRDRHVTRSKELQYEHFWREKAIGAVEEMMDAEAARL